MTMANREWKTAGLNDFMALDKQLEEAMPESLQNGAYQAVLSAILHTGVLRPEGYTDNEMNILSALRMIKEHPELPLNPETILALYEAMGEGKKAEWKISNCWFDHGESFYITASAEKTPEIMADLCAQYAYLNNPQPEQFDDIFEFILSFICVHPFQDANGRMSVLILLFLLQKAGLRCAVYLPFDFIMNGVYMKAATHQIQKASGSYYGMKPLDYDSYIPYMKDILAKSYQIMIAASAML